MTRVYVTILFLIAVLAGVPVIAQNDPAAIKILDRFAETARAASSISMKFDAVTVDQMEGLTDTVTGNIIMSGDKYRLELIDNIVWFNGKTSWSYLPAENEVTITEPESDDDSFMARPSSIFSLYKQGYKSRLLEENTSNYIIDLYPEDIKSDMIRIRLTLSKPALNIKAVEYKNKNGLTITLYVIDYSLNEKTDTSYFTFQASRYKGVEIIDMRLNTKSYRAG